MRINVCPACNAAKNGVKTRKALTHTCGMMTNISIPKKGNKYAKFYALLKQANANGLELTKEQAVHNFTQGSSTSLSGLEPDELAALEQSLASSTRSRLFIPEFDPKADRLRKGIISQFKSVGRTTQDAKAWAEKNGVQGNKRLFNDYTNQELYILFQNAKKVAAAARKALTR